MQGKTSSNPESQLWVETPLVLSKHLSSMLDCDVYLKLENLQPSQSFKYRGISLLAQHLKNLNGNQAHLVIASGGNAGYAAACASKQLGLRCTVYLPEGATPYMLRLLRNEGAQVIIHGSYYYEALQEAERKAADDPFACLIPAYDDEMLQTGHGSIISEISNQLGSKPDAIFCSVGGAGLLGGVIKGCESSGWNDVPIIALETHGSACFYHSMSINNGRWGDTLPEGAVCSYNDKYDVQLANIQIKSKASSLGATSPSAAVVNASLNRPGGVVCVTIPDEMAMRSTCLFAEDHKFLVELACSTTLSPAYHPELFKRLINFPHIEQDSRSGRKIVVFIVCGGVKISLEELSEYQKVLEHRLSGEYNIFCNGEQWVVAAP